MLFYKATTTGNKGGIVAKQDDGPVDGAQGLRVEVKEIVHVNCDTLPAALRLWLKLYSAINSREVHSRFHWKEAFASEADV
jgi:hypothetical protein